MDLSTVKANVCVQFATGVLQQASYFPQLPPPLERQPAARQIPTQTECRKPDVTAPRGLAEKPEMKFQKNEAQSVRDIDFLILESENHSLKLEIKGVPGIIRKEQTPKSMQETGVEQGPCVQACQ
ncbi:hypothetical protein GH733_007984 [Mirounga leonina]|nr:hypothetical protein GH733_007984 [Mirounga leonina]